MDEVNRSILGTIFKGVKLCLLKVDFLFDDGLSEKKTLCKVFSMFINMMEMSVIKNVIKVSIARMQRIMSHE